MVDDKIKLAKSLTTGIWCYDLDNKFNMIYPFTTENIAAYIGQLKGNSLLTTGSSCDQAINAMLYGCKDITIVDICPFVKEYYYLKKAAIQMLTRKEFLDFFCYWNYYELKKNRLAFKKQSYMKLRDVLLQDDTASLYFWDNFLLGIKNVSVRKRLFSMDETQVKILPMLDSYLSSDISYNEIREKINKANVSFINSDIFDLKLDRKFDNINLSNIYDYCDLDKFIDLVYKFDNNLAINGTMLIAYCYLISEGEFDNLLSRLPEPVSLLSFPAVRGIKLDDDNLKDGIIVHKKVKKI